MLPAMSRRGNGASRRVTVLTAALLGVVVGAGAIAGCSTEEEPAPQAQDQKKDKPEQKAGSTPSPERSGLPEELDEPPVHVVLDYFDAWHKSLETGDTDSFMKYATDSCEGCRNMAQRINDSFANGGTLEIERFEPVLDSERNLLRRSSDRTATVILHYDEGKSRIVPEKGASPETHPARRTDQQATMVREGNTWRIEALHVETVKE